jgi:hypothetical protein
MENLIYIIIGILWVAYSLYTARQKAIQKQQNAGLPPVGPSQSSPLPIPGNQNGGKSLLDEILREFTGETRPVQQVPQTVVTPPVPEKSKNVSDLNGKYEGFSNYKFETGPPAEFSFNDRQNSQKSSEIVEQIRNTENISKTFDLRDAVIFSELLNRKYF